VFSCFSPRERSDQGVEPASLAIRGGFRGVFREGDSKSQSKGDSKYPKKNKKG
jgi:hypothetical protein